MFVLLSRVHQAKDPLLSLGVRQSEKVQWVLRQNPPQDDKHFLGLKVTASLLAGPSLTGSLPPTYRLP